MAVRTERRMRLPPDARSAGRARRMLVAALDEAGVDPDVGDTVVLLASELCENAVLHAGTEFDVALIIDAAAAEISVSVTDRGGGALELHLRQPRRGYGRSATHGRGLEMVARLATTWGTRHEADGRHTIWFAIATGQPGSAGNRVPAHEHVPAHEYRRNRQFTNQDGDHGRAAPARSGAEQARWIVDVPPGLVERLRPQELVSELVRRLRVEIGAVSVVVELDEGDAAGSAAVAHDGPLHAGGPVLSVALPVTPPLRGTLTATGLPGDAEQGPARDLAELVANRIGITLQSRWLRAVDERRLTWLAYLAETGELLGQSLDVDLTVAVVAQIVVPRLGRWCAVHLADAAGRLGLVALGHADENEPELRAALDPDARPGLAPGLRAELHGLLRPGARPVRITTPTDGLAVPLHSRGVTIGTLVVGRPTGRPHNAEDVVLIGDVARRAALAVQNAQSVAAHVAVSQAWQRALLPRALPVVPGLEFAAAYLPASGGSDGSDVGGDFYDVLTVDPRRWLLSVGDVCGKGARAAARTGLVRDVLRVLVRGGCALPSALELLNEVMMEAADPMQYCTLAVATVSRPPSGGAGLDVELVLAGHPRAVLVREDGTAESAGAFGTAVGLLPAITVTPTRHHLGPGDALLLYTDGVIERRRGNEQFGTDRLLAAAAGAADRPASELVSAVQQAVARFSPGPGGDDMALLAVRTSV